MAIAATAGITASSIPVELVRIGCILAGVLAALMAFWTLYLGAFFGERAANISEEEYEEEWESKQLRRSRRLQGECVEAENRPAGRWRFAEMEFRRRDLPGVMKQERILEFSADGTGSYRQRELGHPGEIAVTFEWRMEEKTLLVRLKTPVETDWQDIGWGFSFKSSQLFEDENLLWLWLESAAPSQVETAALWPFVGEFELTYEQSAEQTEV